MPAARSAARSSSSLIRCASIRARPSTNPAPWRNSAPTLLRNTTRGIRFWRIAAARPSPVRSASASGVGEGPIVRVHPENRLDAPGRLGDVGGVALVADGQLGPIAHLGIETVRVAQQQARTHAGLTEHPRDV